MFSWILLFTAIVFEVLAMVHLKLSNGFSKVDSSVYTMGFFVLSFLFASLACRKLDVGLAYPIWSGLSTVGIVAAGVLYFDEPSNFSKILFSSLILIGVLGLNNQ